MYLYKCDTKEEISFLCAETKDWRRCYDMPFFDNRLPAVCDTPEAHEPYGWLARDNFTTLRNGGRVEHSIDHEMTFPQEHGAGHPRAYAAFPPHRLFVVSKMKYAAGGFGRRNLRANIFVKASGTQQFLVCYFVP